MTSATSSREATRDALQEAGIMPPMIEMIVSPSMTDTRGPQLQEVYPEEDQQVLARPGSKFGQQDNRWRSLPELKTISPSCFLAFQSSRTTCKAIFRSHLQTFSEYELR
eukprot:CAMPEP_0169185916 /NCGR_PEP_ID=MMETSP1016-20121227/2062_1 /TAXON_ID=342587 /ORGANISM="Karlodinium micrum, Strain CCMP2283" /LENGTH=108 /DNA_ID=CAMNT_0009261673 /DNA_START=956 /DNA_END=1280 /DNA_ORIENTATION=-